MRKRVAKIKAALENLEMIEDPQVEMLLLRSCLGFPKFVFSLRSAPPEDIAETTREFDKMISSTMQAWDLPCAGTGEAGAVAGGDGRTGDRAC